MTWDDYRPTFTEISISTVVAPFNIDISYQFLGNNFGCVLSKLTNS